MSFRLCGATLEKKELIEDQEHRRKKCECVVTLFYPCFVSLIIHTLLGQNCSHERINKKTYNERNKI